MPADIQIDLHGRTGAAAAHAPLGALRRSFLHPAETGLIALTLAIGLLAALVAGIKDQPVAWGKFLISFAPSAGMILLGIYMRARAGMPRAALASIGTGVFIGFTGVITILIYLRFPFDTPMIDAQLMTMDRALFGYDWAAFTTALAEYPLLGQVLGWVYGSSLLQLFAVIFALAWLGRHIALYRVLITGCLSLVGTVAFWWLWPSIGPSAYAVLPAEAEAALGLVHGEAAGAMLMDKARNGVAIISPEIIMGTIAFPSYHTVMMCLSVAFVWGTVFFWPLFMLNLGMLPAILAHGGHHMMDVIGGFAAFGLGWLLALWLIPNTTPHLPSAPKVR